MQTDDAGVNDAPDPNVWLYVPEASYVTMQDPLAIQSDTSLEFSRHDESHLGGYPFFMLPRGSDLHSHESEIKASLICPKCTSKDTLVLIAQLFVPIEGADRVTYVFGCNAYSCEYFCAKRFTLASKPRASDSSDAQLFTESDDWGEDPVPSGEIPSTSVEAPDVYLHQKMSCLPFTSLIQEREVDAYAVYLERVRAQSKQIAENSEPSNTLPPDMPKEDPPEDTTADPVLRDYLQMTEKYQNQVVRWSPNTEPVLICASQNVHGYSTAYPNATTVLVDFCAAVDRIAGSSAKYTAAVPPCQCCGSPRAFEFQIFSTAVYLLGSGYGDWYMNDAMASLGTLMVFSCMNPKCGGDAYVDEYVAYQAGV